MITAVLAVKDKLELTQNFLEGFLRDFNVPIVISCLGSKQDTVEYLKGIQSQYKERVTVVFGNRKETISLSENYNAAINAVTTDKMVIIHNDMWFDKDFFSNLDNHLQSSQEFLLYTTVEFSESLEYHRRPGKVVLFKEPTKDEFYSFSSNLKKKAIGDRKRAYGFFLAGYLESFKDVGGYDFHTYVPCFCEDDDFMVRLRSKGYFVTWDETAVCYHQVGKTSGEIQSESRAQIDVASNRNFVRKWGFEVRFLWETRYEQVNSFQVTNRTIAYQDTNKSFLFNVEPLFQELFVPSVEKEQFIQIAKDIESKGNTIVPIHPKIKGIGEDISSDILITKRGKEDFKLLADLCGNLRISLGTKKLKEGTILTAGPYEVRVLRSREPEPLDDTKNYLSLQEKITYDNEIK